MIEFPRPSLPPKVTGAVFVPDRIAVAEWCSPKSFRVEAGLAWLTERAFEGKPDQNFWWVGDTFGAANAALSLLKSSLTPGSFTLPSRVSAIVLINSATIWFRAGDNPNTLYSDSVFAAVVDSAIHIPERSWMALSETLATARAPVRVLSTVAGRDNWFHTLARRVEEDPSLGTYTRFTALDAVGYGLLTQSDIDSARVSLPDHLFRSLYLAEAYDDRVESAYKAGDPRLMSDAELAIVAGLDPMMISSIPDEELSRIATGS